MHSTFDAKSPRLGQRETLRVKNSRTVGVLTVVTIAVIVLVGWYRLAGPGRPGGEPGALLVDLSGTGDANSETFFARDGWQIRWETQGTDFRISINGDVDVGTAVEQEGPGSGITTPVPTGNFSVAVDAEGPWMLQVTQGD